MPCFTVTLAEKNTVYRLSEMIAAQYDVEPNSYPVAMTWREVNIQASYDNVTADGLMIPIKGGDENLSGLRYGYVLMPGESRNYHPMGSALPATSDKYFMCEEADNMQLSVELL